METPVPEKPLHAGVRTLTLEEMAPACEILIGESIFSLPDLAKGKKVVDIGCGFGRNRSIVENAGGEWVGVEPFEGGAHTVVASAEDLPFEDNSFDVAVMDAVLEHIPNVGKAFSEVARVLKPGGYFVGYSAFMECFHEISYSHLSHKALEYYAQINGMTLEKISGGNRFGMDYHRRILWYPLNLSIRRPISAAWMRFIFRSKSLLYYWNLRFRKGIPAGKAKKSQKLYFQVECLRQSVGFSFVIRKKEL